MDIGRLGDWEMGDGSPTILVALRSVECCLRHASMWSQHAHSGTSTATAHAQQIHLSTTPSYASASPITPLPHLPARLRGHALRPHLALDPRPGLAPRPRGRALRLLGLLLALAGRLLLLAFLDGRLPRRLPRFGTLRAALLDDFEGGADDAALGLDGAAGAFFGDFLGGSGGELGLVLRGEGRRGEGRRGKGRGKGRWGR